MIYGVVVYVCECAFHSRSYGMLLQNGSSTRCEELRSLCATCCLFRSKNTTAVKSDQGPTNRSSILVLASEPAKGVFVRRLRDAHVDTVKKADKEASAPGP